MTTIYLLISIGLNVFLAVSLFFKSALNDIVKDWWAEKRKAKKEQHERLVELRSDLFKLKTDWPMMLFWAMMAIRHQDPNAKKGYYATGEVFSKEAGFILERMKKIEIYFTDDLRSLLSKLPDEFAKLSAQLLNLDNPDKNDLILVQVTLQSSLDRVIELTEKKLRSY